MTSFALTRAGAVSLAASPEGLRLSSPYDAAFVTAFKLAIPASGRKWDGNRKQWLIDPVHGRALTDLVSTFYGEKLELPADAGPTLPTVEIIQLAYLGACKLRAMGEPETASGYTLGNRQPKAPDLVFPESVLRAWFSGRSDDNTPAPPTNSLYSVLCVPVDVGTLALKAAYRRMARQTHPDVNKEPDAHAAFLRVQAAYDVLSEPLKRRKYDAGLVLEARSQADVSPRQVFTASYHDNYRAPLRCGLLLVQGLKRLGRIEVAKIMSWQDLTRDNKVLVSSWPQDGQVWEERWIAP